MKIPCVVKCGSCGSTRLNYKQEVSYSPHHGRFECECGRWIAWVSKELGRLLDELNICDWGDTDE